MNNNLDAIRSAFALLAGLLLVLGLTSNANAVIPVVTSDGTVSLEQIDGAISAIEGREDLDDETKGLILEQLREAAAQVQNRTASEQAAVAFAASIETAPGEIETLTEALNRPAAPDPTPEGLGVRDDTQLRELEQILSREAASLDSTEAQLAQLEADIKKSENRPAEARSRIEELRTAIAELERGLNEMPAVSDDLSDLAKAQRLATELRLEARRAELTKLDQELTSQAVRMELLRVKRDLAARERAGKQQRVDLLTSLVNEERRTSAEEAQTAALEVEQEFMDSHPAVRELARGNAELTRDLPDIAQAIAAATNELNDTNEMTADLEQRLARSEQRLEIAGISQAIGALLVEERRSLPSVAQYRTEVRERRSVLSEIGLAQVQLDEQRRELTPIAKSVTRITDEIAPDIDDEAELEEIREQVRILLVSRRDLLQRTSQSYASYLAVLSDLDVAQRRGLEVAERYKELLDQNLLWIPSAEPVSLDTLEDSAGALAWALSPTAWTNTIAALYESLADRAVPTILVVFLLAALYFLRPKLIRHQQEMNDKVGRLSTDNIGLTIRSLLIVTIRVLPLPLALAYAGWALQHGPDQSAFTLSVAAALLAVSPFLYNTTLFRKLCEKNGVTEVHFNWRPEALAVIRRQFDILIAFGIPIIFALVIFYTSNEQAYRDSFGRLLFVSLMVVFVTAINPLEHPKKGIAARYYDREPGTWLSRLRWVWYVLAVGTPVVLALLALAGFLYTSAILTGKVIDTIWLILAIVVINLVVLRWLALERRKIAWHAALEKRAARKAAEETAPVEAGAEGDTPIVESKPLDLDAVDQQMRRLLRAGLVVFGLIAAWGIWSEILPALNILNQITLWSTTKTIDGVQTVVPVTASDLLLALVIIAATFVASRNLPGLTEIAILQHLDLPPGGRYTINTLLRYVVVTIGVIAVLNIIGLPWSRIQWLVAALSVGLGFGLQEIVANFISGLIILFERPVRVGDTVTVGNLTGNVSRVRIRATTITDWDRKEIVVPNKSFITEQVINWTLSDPITRIMIEVGVSYGSDVKLAHRVIEDTLRSNPLILDEPEPRAYFMGFGDSSLNFKLYMYSRQLGDRFPIMHSVHEDILEALRNNNIEIPFPQRDLHVKSSIDLPIKDG